MKENIQWMKIKKFKNVNKRMKISGFSTGTNSVIYRGKIKLHGTNAGVLIRNDEVYPQSRNRVLSVFNDNAGFAKWLASNNDLTNLFKSKAKILGQNKDVVFFGEWCGNGIMKGTSLAKIDKKILALFCIQVGDEFIYDPNEITQHLGSMNEFEDVFILPYSTEEIPCDFSDFVSVKNAVQIFNDYVEKVEVLDPWVFKTFQVEGNGEGYVFYPKHVPSGLDLKDLVFKSKGTKHVSNTSKAKTFIRMEPEAIESMHAYCDMFLTLERLEQAVLEGCDGEYSKTKTGEFIKWILNDIMIEGEDELVASDFTWKQVRGMLAGIARVWFFKACDNDIN